MEQEAAINYIASGNLLQTCDHIVVLRVTERCEEVLQYFEDENDLDPIEDEPELLVVFKAEGHDIEV